MDASEVEAALIKQINSYTLLPSLKAWGEIVGVGKPFEGLDDGGNARVWREYQDQVEALSQIQLWGFP